MSSAFIWLDSVPKLRIIELPLNVNPLPKSRLIVPELLVNPFPNIL